MFHMFNVKQIKNFLQPYFQVKNACASPFLCAKALQNVSCGTERALKWYLPDCFVASLLAMTGHFHYYYLLSKNTIPSVI